MKGQMQEGADDWRQQQHPNNVSHRKAMNEKKWEWPNMFVPPTHYMCNLPCSALFFLCCLKFLSKFKAKWAKSPKYSPSLMAKTSFFYFPWVAIYDRKNRSNVRNGPCEPQTWFSIPFDYGWSYAYTLLWENNCTNSTKGNRALELDPAIGYISNLSLLDFTFLLCGNHFSS